MAIILKHPTWPLAVGIYIFVFAATPPGLGADAPEPADSSPPALAALPTNAPLRQVGPDTFEIGMVRLDKRQRSITFPSVLNMNEGIVEYFLVATFGKTHESVLRTDVDPYQIHLAMLLLGAKGAGTNAFPQEPDRPLPGDAVQIETSWARADKPHRQSGETMVWNRKTRSRLSPGPWVYNRLANVRRLVRRPARRFDRLVDHRSERHHQQSPARSR